MTDTQWADLLRLINGEPSEPPPVGFIIDSPWLPNWFGISILDYLTSEELWFQANRMAVEAFPEAMFLPGFWSEFGMCTEPSAFGAKCVFYENEFPFAEKRIGDVAQIDELTEPNPETDGLLPLVLKRLKRFQRRLEELGHRIRFSVSRGPLNVASFLMGTTEFMMALKTDPRRVHRLLAVITNYLRKWHALQRNTFPSIDGIFILDDIIGFIGEEDFKEFAFPCLKELYAPGAAVKFFHNDAQCAESIPYYAEIGINLYNPGAFNTLTELRAMGGNRLTILGNIPPRDVLAKGSAAEVQGAVRRLLAEAGDGSRLIPSCAGACRRVSARRTCGRLSRRCGKAQPGAGRELRVERAQRERVQRCSDN
jgi:uroporphyrinogen decarboxylase